MDQNTPLQEVSADDPQTKKRFAAVALNVLALCFALALVGRGLGESFTVFLKPISADFGWDRAQIISAYSLIWLSGGLMAPVIGRPFQHRRCRQVARRGRRERHPRSQIWRMRCQIRPVMSLRCPWSR